MAEFRYEYPIETIVNAGRHWSLFVDDMLRAGIDPDDLDEWEALTAGRMTFDPRPTRRRFGHILDPEITLADTLTLTYGIAYDPGYEVMMPTGEILRAELVRDTPMPDAVRPVKCPVCDGQAYRTELEGPDVVATFSRTYPCPFSTTVCRNGWMTALDARATLYLLAGQQPPEGREPWRPTPGEGADR